MLKPLVILALLTAPALADATAPPAPIRLEMQLRIGKDIRNNVMNVVDNSCGRVEDSTPDHIDEIKACAHVEGANVRLELQWKTHAGKSVYANESSIVVAHGGGVEIGKPDAKLLVRVM